MTASIFNYAHFLYGFDYIIEYRNIRNPTTHRNTDFFSHFPMTETSGNPDYDEHKQ